MRRSMAGDNPPRALAGLGVRRLIARVSSRGLRRSSSLSERDQRDKAGSGGVMIAGQNSALLRGLTSVRISPRSMCRNSSSFCSKKAHKPTPCSRRSCSERVRTRRALRSAPTIRRSRSTEISIAGLKSPGDQIARIHSLQNCFRNKRSSIARADATVSAPVKA